ncbi:MAG: SRPBCC domain-containing protein [Planctomycetota bacterium]
MSDRSQPIITKRTLEYPNDKVWAALTVHSQMVEWFFDMIPKFEPTEGFETEFVIDLEDRVFTHLWKITEVIPGSRIVYDWRYREYEGVGKVIFELDSLGPKSTQLMITNEGLETFSPDVPEFSLESCVDGWNYIADELEHYLAGNRRIEIHQ